MLTVQRPQALRGTSPSRTPCHPRLLLPSELVVVLPDADIRGFLVGNGAAGAGCACTRRSRALDVIKLLRCVVPIAMCYANKGWWLQMTIQRQV